MSTTKTTFVIPSKARDKIKEDKVADETHSLHSVKVEQGLISFFRLKYADIATLVNTPTKL